jgi:hypothetical protein
MDHPPVAAQPMPGLPPPADSGTLAEHGVAEHPGEALPDPPLLPWLAAPGAQ